MTRSEHGGIIKDGAKLVNAVSNSVVPMHELIYTEVEGLVGVQLDYTVYSTPETITVGAGTFSTYKMQCEITSIGGFPEHPDWKRLRSYWAEGVGRIRYYEFFSMFPTGKRYDLVSYAVGG